MPKLLTSALGGLRLIRLGLKFGLNDLLISCIILGGIFSTILDIGVIYEEQLTIEDELKQTAMIAADYVLQQAISPAVDELTWPIAYSPSQNITTVFNFELSIINETLGQVEDEAVTSIALGDADNDGDNDIVVGTSPKGLVVFYENIATNYTAQFNSSLIANFSHQYGRIPIQVGDILIADIENTGSNNILVGTGYWDGQYIGDVFSFEKSASEWIQRGAFNEMANPVIGGVYSLAFGEFGEDSKLIIALGNGITNVFDKSNITIYSKVQDVWEETQLVVTNQSRPKICIGDYTSAFDGNEIIYCTYSDNSTLGYISYTNGSYTHHIIDSYLIKSGDPPPYTRYMNIGIGDFEGDSSNELTVAIDGDGPNQDRLKFYSDTSNVTIIENLEFISDVEFEFADFDNDGRDEVVYCFTNTTLFPDTYLMVYDWNNTESHLIYLETTIETFISELKAGNIDLDDDIEFLYGTEGNGWLRLWDHPKHADYSFEKLAFNVSFIQHKPWIYEDETYPFTVILQYTDGVNSVYDINLTPILPEYMDYLGPSPWINELTPGSKWILNFNLRSETFGSYPVTLRIAFQQIRLFEVQLPFIPRFPLQTQIGQSLLELALYTGDDKYLEAALKVGNWLDSVGIPCGQYRAWNLNSNYTETLMSGYIRSTMRAGQYFLNLYKVTEDAKFLNAALDAANFLANIEEGNFTQVAEKGITWGFSENAIAETAEVGKFLLEIIKLGLGNFSEVITGIDDYLIAIANYNGESINWFESPGLTQAAGNFFIMRSTEGKIIAEQAANWILNKINTNISWFNSLSPSMRSNEMYMHYTGTGLAGIGQFLIDVESKINKSYSDELENILSRLLNITYITEKGLNWYTPIWTTNATDLLYSINYKWGAAGIASFLINLYNKTKNPVFRTYAIGASEWINASLPIIGCLPYYSTDTIETFGDIISSLTKILYVIKPPIYPTTSTTSTTVSLTSKSSAMASTTSPTTKSTTFPGVTLILFMFVLTIITNRRRKEVK